MNNNLKEYAVKMRKNMTDEEKKVWFQILKGRVPRFHRQQIIGNYIVDFYISSACVVIEIDGRQHNLPEHREDDKKRDDDMRMLGNVVLRYTNEDIHERFNAVCEDILKHIDIGVQDLKPRK